MKSFIITVGDELEKGLIPDRNGFYLARKCFERGLDNIGILATGSDTYKLQYFIKLALDKADLVFLLARKENIPTLQESISEAIGVPLVFNEKWLKVLKDKYSIENENWQKIKLLARLPYNARLVENPYDDAAGFIKVLDDVQKAVVFILVGTSFEKLVDETFNLLTLTDKLYFTHMFRTYGKSKSDIEKLLKDVDKKFLVESPKGVDIFVYEQEKEFLQNKVLVIRERLGNTIYTEKEEEMEDVVGRLLKEKGLTISTAESSTGGLIAARIVNTPGSSTYFKGSVVAYSNEVKVGVLKVSKRDLEKFGAVSEPVASQMAKGVKDLLKTDLAVSDTGIAGPTGETKEKPVGLHYIGFATPEEIKVEKVIFKGSRNEVRLRVSQHALNIIRLYLLLSS